MDSHSPVIRFRLAEGCDDLLPRRQHEGDAAYDLRARCDETLQPGEWKLVPTGLFLALPDGFEAQVRPRSGLAAKFGVTVLNAPGTIDSGYRGEVQVVLINHGRDAFEIKRGDRIAQLLFQTLPPHRLVAADDLGETDRSTGGFGSTGRN